MKLQTLAWALLAACSWAAAPAEEPLVDITALEPSIAVEMRYASAENFAKEALYPADRCLLRRSAAEALVRAQARLRAKDLGLKVWDCYRPLSVQRRLWALVPDPRYVADPAKGSRHNRGAAVDATLVDSGGRELEMPTGHDDFSEKAHRNHAGASAAALANRRTLEDALYREGFSGLPTEWWHFDAPGWKGHGLLDLPLR